MAKTLIISEKPSLTRHICEAMNIPQSGVNDKYVVVSTVGHLYTSCDVKEYDEYSDITKWSDYKLPIIIDNFKYKIGKDISGKSKKPILDKIKKLATDSDVTNIIHWCDGDREGQFIGDEIIQHLKIKKPVVRCWHNAEDVVSLQKAFKDRVDNKQYENVYKEAVARQEIDWLYGINATILASVKRGVKITLGRVQTPILEELYNREKEILNFVPKEYYNVSSEQEINGVKFKLNYSEKFNTIEEAKEFCKKLNRTVAEVTNIETKNKKVSPPNMFSLLTLQKHMNKKYGFSANKTMELGQKVYDKKLVTYIRADSEFLKENERDDVRETFKYIKDDRVAFNEKSSIFNDKKTFVHSALHLTTNLNANSLSSEEMLVYEAIKNRQLANFTKEDRIVATTTMTIMVGDVEFKLNGSVEVQKGFAVFEPVTLTDNLPKLNVGDTFFVNFVETQKFTTPPPRYSDTTLLEWCDKPFKNVSLEELENDTLTEEDLENIASGVQLGTTATRSGIIDKLIKSKYVTLEKNKYYMTDLGNDVIELRKKLNINLTKDLSIEIEKMLVSIGKGELDKDFVLNKVKEKLKDIIKFASDVEVEKISQGSGSTIKGCTCPKCNSNILDTKMAYKCSNNDCNFIMWKTQKFYNNKKISESELKKLIKGEVIKMSGVSKKGNKYNANFEFKEENGTFKFVLKEFVK